MESVPMFSLSFKLFDPVWYETNNQRNDIRKKSKGIKKWIIDSFSTVYFYILDSVIINNLANFLFISVC